jgi:replicative DNA helicase
LKEKTALRQLVSTGHYLVEQALVGAQSPDEIVADVSAKLASLSEERVSSTKGLRHIRDIIESFPGGFNTFADYSRHPSGVMTGVRRLNE